MEDYYTFTKCGESPKDDCKVMSKIEIIEEIELDYKTQKLDLYNVIKKTDNKNEFKKISTVDEFNFDEFKK